jgi:glutamate synthase domain-containing protein 2
MIMSEILLYKGLSILFAAGFSFLLLLLILRVVCGNRRTDSVNQQWETDLNVEKEVEKESVEKAPEPIEKEVAEGQAVYVCNVCDWVYDENKGDVDGGIEPGTRFEDIPDSWICPICGVSKEQFKKVIRKQEPGLSYLAHLERPSDELETDMRVIYEKAVTGKSPISAMRTAKQANLLNNVQILPAQLAKKPYDKSEVEVNFQTTIGKTANKPLTINLPFYVSSMSFGSLSKEAKTALAKGAAEVKTLNCSGEGGMLPSERAAAYKYIFQYSTGRFGAIPEVMAQADAIEVKIGQAAKAGLGGHLLADKVTEEIAKIRGVTPHQTIISPANHQDIHSIEDWQRRFAELREQTDGVPIGLKIAASHIEDDLKVALAIKPDFITIDNRGGATGAAPTHIKDNICIPAPYSIYRARKFLRENGAEEMSLLITGGFRTSADIVKALALGADAIGLSTVAMIGIGCQQYRVCHKGTCPIGIATQDEKLRAVFDIDKSAAMLANLFRVYREEIADFVRICGKKSVSELDVSDLVTTDINISQHTNIKHV